VSTPLFHAHELRAGHEVVGPAIIMQDVATVVVEPVRGTRMSRTE
jgi:N-methylhydantoinase A/oxoprolinase/acetone carboxylase beta subunit